MAMAAQNTSVAMAAQKVPMVMATNNVKMAMAARNGIPGGWSLQQGDTSPYSQAHFNGAKVTQEPYFLRLRKALPWWEKHAPRETLALIQEGDTPLSPTRLSGVQGAKEISPRRGSRFGSFGRVYGSGGSSQGPPRGNQTFGSMVCNQQTRKGPGKVEVDFRLQDYQPVFRNKTFQVRPLEEHISIPEKK